MNKPTTIPEEVIVEALEAFDSSAAYGYWGDKSQQWTYSDHYDLDPGDIDWRVTFKVRPDEYASINDYDCYGKIAWQDDRDGHRERPEGFTGAARKLSLCVQRGVCWWEPYREGHIVYDSPDDSAIVTELVDFGFNMVIVEVEYLCDCCGTWAELGMETLGGIDSHKEADLREYAADLLGQLLSDLDIRIVATVAP